MNVVLLAAGLMALRATAGWPLWWIPVAAIALLSLEVQVASLVARGVPLWTLAAAHALAAAVLLARPAGRAALRGRWLDAHGQARTLHTCLAGAGDRRRAGIVLAAVAAVLLVRAVLFVPEAADPYHLVRTSVIAATGSLTHVPVEDVKVNTLGYLYELVLADATLGFDAAESWLTLQGPLLVGVFAVVIARAFVAAGVQIPWYAFALACLMPAVFHQGVLVKNDLFAALLCLPALALVLRNARPATRECAAAGFAAGLALSTKMTTAPVVLALGLFLPWRPAPVAAGTRLAAAGGLVGGVTSGGLLLLMALNVAGYGSPGGPVSHSENLNTTIAGAALSLFRFVVSWVDMSVFTRTVWPGRGGWGGAFGPALAWALCVLVIHARTDRRAVRVLATTLTGLLPFGLVYPDADVAHRLALAPAMAAVVAAVVMAAQRGQFGRRTAVSLTAVACASIALAVIARSATAYLTQAEYLRPRPLALALEPQPGYLSSRLAWQLREANAALGGARQVCTAMQENAMATRGYAWTSAAMTIRDGDSYRVVWRPDALAECDAVVLGPNDYPAPDPASMAVLARCGAGGTTTAAGATDAVRTLRCLPAHPRPQ